MRAFLLPAALIAVSGPVPAAQSLLPEPLPASRYEQMLEKSPFALATPPVAPVEQKAPVFANLVLTGVVPMRDEQGAESYFVSVQSRDRTERFQLVGTEPNKEGIAIASVDWSPQVGKSTVTLKKGSEFGKIEFDEMALQAPAAPQAAPRPGGLQPGMGLPGVNPTNRQPGGRIQVPRPNSVPQANKNVPQPQPAAAPTFPGALPNPAATGQGGDTRRRIRVINSKP